jgi:exodeoxyribonuclease VII small subunit
MRNESTPSSPRTAVEPGGTAGPVPTDRQPGVAPEPPRPPVTALSFREASDELDAIVAGFEQGEVDVDRLVEQLQRATAIVEELDRRLRATQAQVEELVPRLDAAAHGRTPADHTDAAEADDRF